MVRGLTNQSGISIAKKPPTWRTSISPSTSGSFFASKVLKTTAMETVATVRSTACHEWGT
jgi:hypothetical protein